jgi:hypothetical protein
MSQRIRRHDDQPVSVNPSPASGGAGTADLFGRARALSDDMLDAVEGKLSNDSRRFVDQNRQQGGQ